MSLQINEMTSGKPVDRNISHTEEVVIVGRTHQSVLLIYL
jgi:hypothetical protein